jgi:ADP-ribose pyrophosphatase
MELFEKQISSKQVYNGNLLKIFMDEVELENGKIATREFVKHPGGACVAALNEKNELFFVKQFRYPYGKVVLELPAGKLDPNEPPLQTAIRELKEETGMTTGEMISIGELYPSPGYTDEIIYLYACRVESQGEKDLDDDEFLEVESIPIEEAVSMVLENKIKDSKSQVAILKTAKLLENKKI